MATIQEMQKARELMKTSWLDLKTAVAQARTPVATTPVDPTTGLSKPLEPVVQPTPTAVAPIAPTPVTAEVKTPEPVKTEVASAISPVKPVKQEPVVDYTQAKGRESEITANLDSFKAKWMTPDEIMRASDYQNASPEKKALIEPYLKQQVPTASAMYNAIASKADIPDEQKTSLSYKIANNRYAKANMYSTMTPSQLSSEMTSSKLIQGSQAYEDLKAMNPKLVQDTENLRIVNGSKNNLFTYVNNPDGTTKKVNNLEETFKNDFLDNFAEEIKKMFTVQTPEQIRAIIRTPDVVSAEDNAFEYEGKINEIDKQIEASDAEVEARLAWSGATGNRIALEKSAARDKFNKDRDSMVKEYTRYANKANNLTTQNMTMYTTQQQQQQSQNAAMLPFITDQYKTEQAKIAAEQALQDPATQIEQTMQEFAKMGITAQGNTASKIAEFNTSGLSLPAYITQLRSQFMSKPEYKKALELKEWAMSDTEKMQAQNDFDIKKIKLQDSMKDKNIQRIGGTTENPIYGYFDWEKMITVNAPTQSPAGTYNPKNDSLTTLTLENGKPIKMLSEPANALATLINWNPDVKIDYNNLYREQADQFRLYGKGRSAEQLMKEGIPSLYADPTAKQVTWTTKSQHMTGSAVDLVKPTPATIAKMNSAWFFQPEATKKWDSGHFEYMGAGSTETPIGKLGEYIVDIQPRWVWFSDADAKAFTQSVNKYVNAWDEQAVYQLLRNKILENKNVWPDIYDNAELKSGLENMKSLLTAYKESGGDTSILSNMAETVANKLGTTTDIQLAKSKNQLGVLVADYIRAISGTAASDTEVQRLIGNMPQMKNIDSFNMGLIDNLQNIADRRIQSKLNTYLGSKKDQAPNLFPEFYTSQTQSKQNTQANNSQDAELEALYGSIPN